MKISPETQNRLLVTQFVLMVVSVIALLWFSVSLYQLNQEAAVREARIQEASVLTTRCALNELLDVSASITRDLGLRIDIVRPNVSGVNCVTLLQQEVP